MLKDRTKNKALQKDLINERGYMPAADFFFIRNMMKNRNCYWKHKSMLQENYFLETSSKSILIITQSIGKRDHT